VASGLDGVRLWGGDPLKVAKITLESDYWEEGSWDPHDVNSDVFVTLEDGSVWIASFFTYTNLESLIAKNRKTGEWLSGRYFWSSDMVFVDVFTRARVAEVIDEMIANLEFESAFDRCDPEAGEGPCDGGTRAAQLGYAADEPGCHVT
jgi:hypothetical protein